MTTSASGATNPWVGDAWGAESDAFDSSDASAVSDVRRASTSLDDHDLLAQEQPAPLWPEVDEAVPHDWGAPPTYASEDAYAEIAVGRWDRIHESTTAGLTTRGLVLTTAIAAGGCALLDLGLTAGRMTFFFDLCFVVICLVAAMAVRREDLFTAGVLPPLLFAGVIAVVAVVAPDAFEAGPGVSKVFLSGLASHAAGLVGGYAVALLAVAARMAGSEHT
jgi:hypothetical protein